MRYIALACDYDGTLARDGIVDDATVAALERLKASGRRLLMVTGRELNDLRRVCPSLPLFDRVVAENGAVLYNPAAGAVQPLAAAPPAALVEELKRRSVTPLSVGDVIVATWEPHDGTVLEVIRDLGLELQVIFNKGAVMVLPSGVNKATGLRTALEGLKLSLHNVVGVGDAENDHAFLSACECSVAVANALASVKERVDSVTVADHGAGVIELIDRLIDDDLQTLAPRLVRHDLTIGRSLDGNDVRLALGSGAVLLAGPSGAGKSTITTALVERLHEAAYQVCVIDPEGDFYVLPGAIALRGGDESTLADDVVRALDNPSQSVVATLLDLRLDDRPAFLQRLLPRLLEMRARSARPHWIVIDEAHHLLPSSWQPSAQILPTRLDDTLFVTVHPDHVASAALALVRAIIAVGRDPQATLDAFAKGRGEPSVALPDDLAHEGNAWLVEPGAAAVPFFAAEPAGERRRHQRKYAAGELGEDVSFYFHGPEGRLNLRAQNLELFTQLADGVDDETWTFHLKRHDVSQWFRSIIKDEGLATEAVAIESNDDLSPAESRARIRAAVEARYTRST